MMRHRGLAKLSEEMGELQQVIGKMLQYPQLQDTYLEKHPDGSVLRTRIVEEMGDVLAAVFFTIDKMGLDPVAIEVRSKAKHALFNKWFDDGEPL